MASLGLSFTSSPNSSSEWILVLVFFIVPLSSFQNIVTPVTSPVIFLVLTTLLTSNLNLCSFTSVLASRLTLVFLVLYCFICLSLPIICSMLHVLLVIWVVYRSFSEVLKIVSKSSVFLRLFSVLVCISDLTTLWSLFHLFRSTLWRFFYRFLCFVSILFLILYFFVTM